mmetsp:Transcript_19914/g.47448  ORF Transcript_19914/g.47448 Transcript_19914/m.47448 type:complete len:444 (-) Transcript_19914:132-1463(-)
MSSSTRMGVISAPARSSAGPAARSLSERHWIEEWAVLRRQCVAFYGHRSRKPHFSLALADVVRAGMMPPGERPFDGFGIVEVHTVGRVFLFMFRSEGTAAQWVDSINRLLPVCPPGRARADSPRSGDSDLDGTCVTDPGTSFLHKSKLWSSSKRRVLNCRRAFVRSGPGPRADPCEAVERALHLCSEFLSGSGQKQEEKLIQFLDAAASLKIVRADELPQAQRWAFFVNVYHLMIMHAQVVLGPPTTPFQWLSYFNTVAYQIADDVFSLSELEHCILRAGMARPNPPTSAQLISKLMLPTSKYSFALNQGDFRLNFVLNCGSLSNLPTVPIYRAETLNEQFDETCKRYLSETVSISPKGKTAVLLLPKVCQWYLSDFGTTLDCARAIVRFLPEEQGRLLRGLMGGSPGDLVRMMDQGWMLKEGNVTVRYLPYDFHCRQLRLEA